MILLLLSAQVAVVKWGDGEPWNTIEAGIKKIVEVDVFSLDRGKKSIPSLRNYKVVIACGWQTVEKVLSAFSGNVVGAGILPEDNLKKEKRLCGVYLVPSFMDQLALLREFLPGVKKIGVIFNVERSSSMMKDFEAAATNLGISCEKATAQTPGQVNIALKFMKEIDAFFMVPDEVVLQDASFKFILMASYGNLFPVYGVTREYVKAGALFSLSPDYMDMGEKAGNMAKKILGGSNPSSLGKVYPRGEVVINLRIAEKLGVDIPRSVMSKAKEVFR